MAIYASRKAETGVRFSHLAPCFDSSVAEQQFGKLQTSVRFAVLTPSATSLMTKALAL